MNSTVHRTTQLSPFAVAFGFEPNTDLSSISGAQFVSSHGSGGDALETLIAQELAAHPALQIVGAGPEPMLADLDAAISALCKRGGGAPAPWHRLIRLTHSM